MAEWKGKHQGMGSIREILDLEKIDSNIYRGPAIKSAFKRTFGGQVAAQTLVAATRTVDSKLREIGRAHV